MRDMDLKIGWKSRRGPLSGICECGEGADMDSEAPVPGSCRSEVRRDDRRLILAASKEILYYG